MPVIADYLRVTVPALHTRPLEAALAPLLAEAGAHQVTPALWRFPGLGTLKVQVWPTVTSVDASGEVLAELRGLGLLDELLGIIGSFPHQVTRLDVALDVCRDAAPVLAEVYATAREGGIRFGRKALRPQDVARILSGSHYAPEVETGTVYLGQRGNGVFGRVYDRRQRLMAKGELDLGPAVRFEFEVGKRLGVTLRDASVPAPLFWAIAADQFGGWIDRPTDVPAWEAHAEGYALPRREPPTHSERLARACERSAALQGLCQLALPLGYSEGLEQLQGHVRGCYAQTARTVKLLADLRRAPAAA